VAVTCLSLRPPRRRVSLDLDQEAEEFGLLINGNDPDTGEPFAGDLRAIFDT